MILRGICIGPLHSRVPLTCPVAIRMIAHILNCFSQLGDLVFDPITGGSVLTGTCLAFNRRR